MGAMVILSIEQAPGSPAQGGGTDTLDRELEELLEQETIEPGDHERFSHYVKKALCGKKWLPGRDPEKFPVCPDCKRIYEGMKPE
jgi:hypothetical protein